jgi:hypothetical protein
VNQYEVPFQWNFAAREWWAPGGGDLYKDKTKKGITGTYFNFAKKTTGTFESVAGQRSVDPDLFFSKPVDRVNQALQDQYRQQEDKLSYGAYEPMRGQMPGWGRPPKSAKWVVDPEDPTGDPIRIKGDIDELNATQFEQTHLGLSDVTNPYTKLTDEQIANNASWQRRFMKGRAKRFYRLVDPSSYGERFLNENVLVGRSRGRLFDVMVEGDNPEDALEEIWNREIIPGAEEAYEDDIQFNLEDEAAELISSEEESFENIAEQLPGELSDYSGGIQIRGAYRAEKRAPKLTKYLVTKAQLADRIAAWEYQKATKMGNKIFTFSPYLPEYEKFMMDKPTKGGSAIISTDAEMLDLYQEVFGQRKWLKPVGSSTELDFNNATELVKRITPSQQSNYEMLLGIEEALATDSAKDLEKTMGKLNQMINTAIRESTKKTLPAAVKAQQEEEFAEFYAQQTENLSPTQTSLMDRLVEQSDAIKEALMSSKTRKQKNAIRELKNSFLSSAKLYLEKDLVNLSDPIKASGLSEIQREIQDADIGTLYEDVKGNRYEVADVTSLSNIKVQSAKGSEFAGKVITAQELSDQYRLSSLRRMSGEGIRPRFDLYAVRRIEEGTKKPIVDLYFGTGESAGIMRDIHASRLRSEIEQGYLGTLSAEFREFERKASFPDVSRKKYLTARLFRKEFGQHGEALSGEGLGTVAMTEMFHGKQLKGKNLFTGEQQIIEESWNKALSGSVPEMLRYDEFASNKFMESTKYIYGSETIHPEISKAFEAKGPSRGFWIGATIAAGAMLLWSANRVKGNQTLTPEDVPDSLYGSARSPSPSSRSPVGPDRNKTTRVSKYNTGYETNIDVEARDDNGIVDHRDMARTLGNMASKSLGSTRTRTSLHVIDDSQKKDRHTTERKMNQLIRA